MHMHTLHIVLPLLKRFGMYVLDLTSAHYITSTFSPMAHTFSCAASRDGFSNAAFHENCDDFSPTLTIVQLHNGRLLSAGVHCRVVQYSAVQCHVLQRGAMCGRMCYKQRKISAPVCDCTFVRLRACASARACLCTRASIHISGGATLCRHCSALWSSY